MCVCVCVWICEWWREDVKTENQRQRGEKRDRTTRDWRWDKKQLDQQLTNESRSNRHSLLSCVSWMFKRMTDCVWCGSRKKDGRSVVMAPQDKERDDKRGR